MVIDVLSSTLSSNRLDVDGNLATGSFVESRDVRQYVECGYTYKSAHSSPLGDKGTEAATLSSQLVQGLSLMQGVALVHHRSKVLLGGKHAQEVRTCYALHAFTCPLNHIGPCGSLMGIATLRLPGLR